MGFALSLTGVNPTFFKVTGQKSGAPGKVDKFPRGQNVVLFNVDWDYDPIEINDSATFGGLKIDFKIEKAVFMLLKKIDKLEDKIQEIETNCSCQ